MKWYFESDEEPAEAAGRTDDPVRMYLREMGNVDLLSREGEISIAKRIESGKEMLLGGLCESPLTARALEQWREQLQSGKLMLREIITLDTNANFDEEDDADLLSAESDSLEEDEVEAAGEEQQGSGEVLAPFSAVEQSLYPKVTDLMDRYNSLYIQLWDRQEKLIRKSKKSDEIESDTEYQKIKVELIGVMEEIKLNPRRIEDLLHQHQNIIRSITSQERALVGFAEACGVQREQFLSHITKDQIDERWVQALGKQTGKGWETFFDRHEIDLNRLATSITDIEAEMGLPFRELRRIITTIQRGRAGIVPCKKRK